MAKQENNRNFKKNSFIP